MTTAERVRIHIQIERENEQKIKAWKEGEKMNKVITLQKDHSRYIFVNENGRFFVEREQCLTTGSSFSRDRVSREAGNELYKSLIEKGFLRFRNVKEVSWYATTENNTPFDEVWKIENGYLVPIASQVLC